MKEKIFISFFNNHNYYNHKYTNGKCASVVHCTSLSNFGIRLTIATLISVLC